MGRSHGAKEAEEWDERVRIEREGGRERGRQRRISKSQEVHSYLCIWLGTGTLVEARERPMRTL